MTSIKGQDESIKAYFVRICENRVLLGLIWEDVKELMNKETGKNFQESAYRKRWASYKEGLEDGFRKAIDEDSTLKEHELSLLKIQEEKVKVQTEKLELRTIVRESARIGMFFEYIDKAISKLSPIKVPKVNRNFSVANEAILSIADAHYGSEFVIKGLMGEEINSYSPEIFEKRMWELFDYTVDLVLANKITKLFLADLGDSLDGLLHLNQLLSLRYGQTDSIMRYSEFMANWINALSEYCDIEWSNIKGNHSENRPFNSNRGDFPNENGERLVAHIIKIRLANNKKVIIHETQESPAIYFKCNNYDILACHGQYENGIDNIISSYKNFYNVSIDIGLMGHLHRNNSKTVSSNANGNVEIIQCASLVGINKFAEGKKLSARAGAKMICFKKYGRQITDIVFD